jgi:hypothetical protein
MRKLLKKYGFVPDRLVTDDLRSYAAAAHDHGISNRHDVANGGSPAAIYNFGSFLDNSPFFSPFLAC